MSQDVVAAQPYLPVVQDPSQTIVAFIYATSFFSRLLYDFLDVAFPVGSAVAYRFRTSNQIQDVG